MPPANKDTAISKRLVIRIQLKQKCLEKFSRWQARLHSQLAAFPEFSSMEVLSPTTATESKWVIVQYFNSAESLKAWRYSEKYLHLLADLKPMLEHKDSTALQEEMDANHQQYNNALEIFVTQVAEAQQEAYQTWLGKIHEAEAQFPGFQRVYVQAPKTTTSHSWITLLQFDTAENLEHWLNSAVRQRILKEASSFIENLESHHVSSPFAGWFEPTNTTTATTPVWKQTMIVLLVLFPIVMLEFKFINPWLQSLDLAVATFIGNTISVILIAWPMAPLAIYYLQWWLSPRAKNPQRTTWAGIAALTGLYLLEILFFSYFQ